MRWVEAAEEAAAGISFDYFLIYSAGVMALVIFVCWCCIINLELYMLCPGWGPVRRFDSDGNEEMRINQLMMHEEKGGYVHAHKKAKGRKGGDSKLDFLKGALAGAKDHAESLGRFEAMEAGDGESWPRRWDDMKEDQKTAWSTLGWTRESWNRQQPPASNNKYYGLLSSDEKAAARRLGYDAKSWDESKLKKHSGSDNGLFTGFQESYGAIGKCTWGYCESPFQWGTVQQDPRYGEVVVRHGFSDTQWMRQNSRTWAKDENYFLKKEGFEFPDLSMDESCTEAVKHRMVIESSRL
jgi:hypothetical protein